MKHTVQCKYCVSKSRHPLFVYLLSDKRCINDPSKHKVVPYIGLASNPFIKLCAHNRMGKKFGPSNQLTKLGAGNYQLELVYGPVFIGGRNFRNVCRKKSRKIVSRILAFCDHARSLQRSAEFASASLYVRDREMIHKLYDARRTAATSKND